MTQYNIREAEGNCTNCASPNVEKKGRNQIHCRDCDFLCSASEHLMQFADGDTAKHNMEQIMAPYLLAGDWCSILDVYDTFFSENENQAYDDSFDSTIFVRFTFSQYGTIYNFKKVPFPGNVIFYFPDGAGNMHSHLDKRLLLVYNNTKQGMYQEALKHNLMVQTVLTLDEKFKKHRFKALPKLQKIFSKMEKNHG